MDYDDISPLMKQAIIAVEDRRYFEHHGVDMRAIGRALWADIRQQGVVQGGSTITQQFIKNSCSDTGRTVGRKVREATLAWGLEQQWSKRKILTSYLNTVYFGNGAYGVDQAARTYFGHRAKKMTLWEVALLAGIPADPSRYDPVANPRAAKQRRRTVLRTMLALGTIDAEQFRRADREPLPNKITRPDTRGPGGYFANYVTQQLVDRYKTRGVFGGGLVVHTTLDLELQKLGHRAIARWLKDENGPAAALVAIDPRDGAVKAMIGGSNFRESQFNLAVQGERQAGSSFKPFVLAAALEQGISPETTFVSKPTTIFLGDKYWPVSNYEDEYLGSANLKTATIHSDNSVYAQLTALVGPRNVRREAQQLGISSRLNDYFSIGLGTEAVNPLEMARAFSTFANRGRRVDGSIIGNKPRAISWVHRVGEKRRAERARPEAGAQPGEGRSDQRHPPGGHPAGHRNEGCAPRPAGGRQDRNDGELRRCLVRGLHAAAGRGRLGRLPEQPHADADGVRGRRGRGRDVPGADLEVVHGLRAEAPGRGARVLRSAEPPVRGSAQRRAPRRPGHGRQRPLPRPEERLVLLGRDAGARGGVQAERGRGPAGRRRHARRREGTARRRSRSQYDLIYRPAKPGERLDVVLGQMPRRGTLSAYDNVTLILAKPRFGIVPNVVGMPVSRAVQRLEQLKLQPAVVGGSQVGRVVRQKPRGGRVAAAPGLPIRLIASAG